MSREIVIVPMKVNKVGNNYLKYSEDFKEIQGKLRNVEEGILEAWPGADNKLFLKIFSDYVDSVNDIVNYLEEKGNILIGAADGHKTADEQFANRIKPKENVENEYRNSYRKA